jgi:two-component system OmpR family response regulator
VRVLVVDDEPDLADLVSTALRFDGCRTATAGDADEAMRVARDLRPDIAVLDMMLPGDDGVKLLGRLRAEHPDLPAVFLTARGDTRDRIAGLRAGADDYIAKPFSLEELLARLQAVLRRTGRLDERQRCAARRRPHPRRAAREVQRDGEAIDLTPTEFDLLRFLMQNAHGREQGPDPRPRLALRLRRTQQHRASSTSATCVRKVDADRDPLIHRARRGYRDAPPQSGRRRVISRISHAWAAAACAARLGRRLLAGGGDLGLVGAATYLSRAS